MSKKISINENGVWAGTGDLIWIEQDGGHFYIANCPAELGSNSAESDEAYDDIQAALNNGENQVSWPDGQKWTWEIYDAE